jgi:ATP-dependent DNA ligase
VALALTPPIEPMLARLVREFPREEGLIYEPKWDGFRCLAFRDGDDVDLRSRNQRPLARYFPELVAGLKQMGLTRFVVDGEIVVSEAEGLDFTALLQRLHPAASRVARLSRETPASFIAFDLLALGDEDLRAEPFVRRRELLEGLLEEVSPPILLTPATAESTAALRWLELLPGGGIDGVIAKPPSLRYQPGKRAMQKVKTERTAECIVAGFRWHPDIPVVGSLLLGLYDGDTLRHAGLAASFTHDQRHALTEELLGYVVPLEDHPWQRGFNVADGPVGRLPGAASRWSYGDEITWVPLRPTLVCEVSYDHLQGERFRHPPKFRRWRPDRDPRSCTYTQFPRNADLGSKC